MTTSNLNVSCSTPDSCSSSGSSSQSTTPQTSSWTGRNIAPVDVSQQNQSAANTPNSSRKRVMADEVAGLPRFDEITLALPSKNRIDAIITIIALYDDIIDDIVNVIQQGKGKEIYERLKSISRHVTELKLKKYKKLTIKNMD